MTKIKKYSGKALGIILSLLMILTVIPSLSLTAFAAPTETLLTKITPTGTNTYSESVAGVVTVTLSNISRYSSSSGWAYGGTVTVAPKAGYTITKCIFDARAGAVEDTEAPFSIDVGSVTNVGSVEVYGYQAPSSSYVDGSGKSQTVNATELATSTTSWTNGSWYIAPEGGLTISGRITVNGTVNLILRDGATLTASAGITTTNATLNIYAQSAGTGALTAKGSKGCAGIGGCGGAYEENGGAGGTVSIFGGTVTATGGTAANLGYGAGAGIGGGGAGLGRGQTGGAGGTVSIFGGTVTATGGAGDGYGGAGAGIGGGGKEKRGSAGANGTLTLGKGVKLYSGTNNSGTVLDGSDSTARSYSGSRPQNMFAELYTGPNKTDLNTAITAAETLYDSIKDDTNYSTIASTLKTALDAAKAVADSETADQDAVDAAKTAITTAKTNAEAAKKDVDDTNAANAVITKINALPAADDVTTANKEAIEAARAAYNALTDDQKKKVDATVLAKLTDAETALQDAIDTETAGAATNTINALPDADEVTTANKDAIEAARKAYNDLTDDQKKKVSDDTLKKLTDAEDALKAAGVSDTINALPAADEVTTANKEAIAAARKAYDDLTDDQKSYVAPETLKKLTDAESALTVAEVNAAIDALPAADEVTTANKEAIEAARKAYDALTDDEKAKITPETLKKLTDAESALAVATAIEAINALPAADEVTTANKDAIEAARKAYNDLTDDQKAKVSEDTLKKLTDAESAFTVASVSEKINALPDADKVTTADKEAIEEARGFYDALTDAQKTKVSEDTLKKLTDAEAALKDAVDTAAANTASEAINDLPDADKVTTADKDAIEAARKAYDDLTDDQKAKVDAETLKKLTDAEAALKDAVDTAAANTVSEAINALPDADKVTTADKDAIKAARKAYDDLTDDQKAKVDAETLKKLTDAETALAAAEKDAADTAAANTASETINALPDADKVTTADKDAIEAARKAYDDLTDDQKAKVDAETLKKLTDAETALAAAEKKVADEEQAAKELAAAKTNAQKAMNNQITVTQTGKKITVKWSKSTAADGYMVYVQYCGKKFSKPVKTIKKNSTTKVNITKINGKKINLKKQFKVFVRAYKVVNGKKVILAKSIIGHIVGVKNAKYTNVKSLKVTKSKLTVKVGKTAKVKANVTLVDKNKKHIPKSHAPKFRYRTSNKKIATVDKNGKIKGIKKGTCTIYVYAINGKMKKVKVTVK